MTETSGENLSSSLEDYLEIIFHLEQVHRVARAKDIADHMNVQRASVTGALRALAGRRVAEEVIRRHDILKDFFMTALQLEPGQAEANACRIEHAIDPGAIDRLVHFLEFIKNCPRAGDDWLAAFAHYCQEGIRSDHCDECLQSCVSALGPPGDRD